MTYWSLNLPPRPLPQLSIYSDASTLSSKCHNICHNMLISLLFNSAVECPIFSLASSEIPQLYSDQSIQLPGFPGLESAGAILQQGVYNSWKYWKSPGILLILQEK